MTPKELIKILEQLPEDAVISIGDCDFTPSHIYSAYFDPNYNELIINSEHSTNYEPETHLIYQAED